MRFTKKIALLEFGMNLTAQKILTNKEFYEAIHNFYWRFFNFDIGYWEELREVKDE